MTVVEDMMKDPFYTEIIGSCRFCGRETPRGESHNCEKCGTMYCMNCVFYDTKGQSAMIYCPKKHFLGSGINYEEEGDLEKLT